MTQNELLARAIDHTALKPETTKSAIEELCKEAIHFGFASVCVLPHYVALASDLLTGSKVKVCTVIGFPLGSTFPSTKSDEANCACSFGATELDMVINISALKSGAYIHVEQDIVEVVRVAHDHDAITKVIIETCLLTESEKKLCAKLVTVAGAEFIKTSTGFSSGGATLEDVKLLRREVGDHVQVKASGGIRTADFALQLLSAGATRIGASAGVAMMVELDGK